MPIRRFMGALESRYMQWFVILLMVFSLVASVYVSYEVRAHNECLAHWGTQLTTRTERVFNANKDRTDALARLLAAQQTVFNVTAMRPFDNVKFEMALDAEIHANKNYEAANHNADVAAKQNPIPPAPKYLC